MKINVNDKIIIIKCFSKKCRKCFHHRDYRIYKTVNSINLDLSTIAYHISDEICGTGIWSSSDNFTKVS